MSDVQLYIGDCLDILPTLPNESVDLAFCDPPYNIGIFCKMPEADYLAWCEQWIAEASRVLAANGAFWVVHKDPEILVELSRMIAARGRKRINWITWDKYNAAADLQGFMDGYTIVKSLRSFQVMAEYLIYHAGEGEWTAQCDRERGFIFESLRAYLKGEVLRAGLTTRRIAEAFQEKTGSCTVTGMAGHWLERVQWVLPTAENYEWLRGVVNTGGRHPAPPYEDYHDAPRSRFERNRNGADYEDLRADYEDLRYTFNNPGKVSSVWQIPPAPSNGHPTPKPEELLRRIILATSNEGDTVLDPFVGSGTTGKVSVELSRHFCGIDTQEKWIGFTEQRIAEAQMQPRLEGI